jgi:hypothetical protein
MNKVIGLVYCVMFFAVVSLGQNTAVVENPSKTITGISVNDIDVGTGELKVVLTATKGKLSLAGLSGLTFTVGDGADDLTMTFTGKMEDVNSALSSILYTVVDGASGTDALVINVNDQGNTGIGGPKQDTKSITITIPSMNAAPIVVVPAAQSTNEDIVKSITGVRVTDIDVATGMLTATLEVTNGKLSLRQVTGLTFTTGSGLNDQRMIFSGTLVAVNTAISTLKYTPNSNYYGTDTVSILVNDQGNTGVGGPKEGTGSIAVTIASQNDAPALVIPGPQTITI